MNPQKIDGSLEKIDIILEFRKINHQLIAN